jgi:hypothetical protein
VKRITVLAVAAGWLALGSPVQGSPNGADWSHPRVIRTAGLAAAYPRGWHAARDGGTLLIWSRGAPEARSPERINRIPTGGVWIWLMDYGPRYAAEYEPRPKHFELRDEDVHFQSCGFGFDGWNLAFVDRGQVVQAVVGLGEGAGKDDATELLDRLVVEPPS